MLEWKIFNLDNQDKELDFFNIKINGPDLGKDDIVKLCFEPVEPEESIDGTFLITPR